MAAARSDLAGIESGTYAKYDSFEFRVFMFDHPSNRTRSHQGVLPPMHVHQDHPAGHGVHRSISSSRLEVNHKDTKGTKRLSSVGRQRDDRDTFVLFVTLW